ncbi:hypothetical protein LTR37_014471 [Vermiconidia calcicola]|uniref:Uncharacterized protein n=1 Tax=Vermiconidia calcicola TaxID=1690605 RepID=A0ACC3MTH2_9PEZI|nr:hypothetical protein LTR37_014471 [Vermiconidia calcicola]
MATKSRIAELSAIISTNTAILDDYLTSNNLPHPSFDAATSPSPRYPPDAEAARVAIEEATAELNELVQGPGRLLMGSQPAIFAAKAFISKFDIASFVPAEGTVSYASLASKTRINQGAIEALLRHAIAHRIFIEPTYGHVAHSAASKLLLNPQAVLAGKAFADDFFPMTASIVPALATYPHADEPTQAAAAVANGVANQKSFYDMLADHPERSKHFHETVAMAGTFPGLSWKYVVAGFDWISLPPGSLCVDVGGGHGEAAFAVAKEFPHLKWVVQDTSKSFENRPQVPDGMQVEFVEHDFFQPSPETTNNAAVFFLRWILHNWPDQYCHRIWRALIPSLRTGTKILVMEELLPMPGSVPNAFERGLRSMDVGMVALGNGRERDMEQWKRLFAEADGEGRFNFDAVLKPEGSQLVILQVTWKG